MDWVNGGIPEMRQSGHKPALASDGGALWNGPARLGQCAESNGKRLAAVSPSPADA
ncbi:hypothetical protein BH160DRAFT_4673 [Burkholderia sp. H160]|nr:hypothetical protein BH160DRAFT_4673 [Burkholderia sp. H160]